VGLLHFVTRGHLVMANATPFRTTLPRCAVCAARPSHRVQRDARDHSSMAWFSCECGNHDNQAMMRQELRGVSLVCPLCSTGLILSGKSYVDNEEYSLSFVCPHCRLQVLKRRRRRIVPSHALTATWSAAGLHSLPASHTSSPSTAALRPAPVEGTHSEGSEPA
jgi:hypothetical protein